MPHSSASLAYAFRFGLLLVSQLSLYLVQHYHLFLRTLQGLNLSPQHHSCPGECGKSHQPNPNHASCAVESLVQKLEPLAEFLTILL